MPLLWPVLMPPRAPAASISIDMTPAGTVNICIVPVYANSIVPVAIIIGDGRNFCTAIFALDAEMLAAFALREGLPADPSHPRIYAVLQAVVDEATSSSPPSSRSKHSASRPLPSA